MFTSVFFVLVVFVVVTESSGQDDGHWLEGMFSGFQGTVRSILGMPKATQAKLPLAESEIENVVQSSKDLIQNGKLIESLDSLLEIYEINPSHQECNSLIGGLLMSIQQTSLAENFLYSAITLSNWTDSISVSNLAESLRQNAKTDLSLKVLMRGLNAINNTDPSGTLSRSIGNIYYFEKNYSLAADWFLNAAMSNPVAGGVEDWLKASTMVFPDDGKDFKFAENVLLQAITALPRSSQLFYQLGMVMHLTNREEQAIVFYDETIRLDAMNYPVYASLATAYHTLGSFEKAFEIYTIAANVDGKNVIMLVNFGKLLHTFDQKTACLEMAHRASEIDATNQEVVQLLALCQGA